MNSIVLYPGELFTSGYYPAYKYGKQITSTNPITWNSDNKKSEYNLHEGILMPGNKIRFKNTVSAQAIGRSC